MVSVQVDEDEIGAVRLGRGVSAIEAAQVRRRVNVAAIGPGRRLRGRGLPLDERREGIGVQQHDTLAEPIEGGCEGHDGGGASGASLHGGDGYELHRTSVCSNVRAVVHLCDRTCMRLCVRAVGQLRGCAVGRSEPGSWRSEGG